MTNKKNTKINKILKVKKKEKMNYIDRRHEFSYKVPSVF